MDIKAISRALLILQNSLLSPVIINDAIIDIIEINHVITGKSSYCAPHVHTWFEMNYSTRNSMVTGVDNDVFKVSENEFLLIPPGVEHYHTYDPLQPYECFVLRWIMERNSCVQNNGENSFFDFLNELRNYKPHAVKDVYGICDSFELLLKDADNRCNPVSMQLLMARIISFLSWLCADKSASMVKKDAEMHSLVRKVEVLLNDNFIRELSVDAIARSLHISYGHLTRVYKKHTGITILERMNQIRVEKSKELLLNTDYSIKEISFKVGFESQFYFSRLFRLKTGMSPSEFRQKRTEQE